MMRGKKIRQHETRWNGLFWTWPELFKLYRDEGETRPDAELKQHCIELARQLNRLDRVCRYHNMRFAQHEAPQGLLTHYADTADVNLQDGGDR